MRLHRFYVNKPLGEEIVVENVESEKGLMHQWTTVFRYTSGDEVILFSSNDPGTDHIYKITSLSKQSITLAPLSTSKNVVPSYSFTLVMALVKKDTFETIVRQATELGITRIIPLAATRSEKKNLNFERLQIIATEASEQSGRGTVPTIDTIVSFEEALTLTKGATSIIGSLYGKNVQSVAQMGISPANGLRLWIGPEGGWTEEEENKALENGFISMKSADTVLKADTAAASLLSIVSILASLA